MKTGSFYRNIIELNLAVILISTSGVLGRYIDLPVPLLICIRALIAGGVLFIYCKIRGVNLSIKKKDWSSVFVGGAFLGAHWVTYFYALKLSNVAIGMISLFTFPVLTTILEPLMTKSKFQLIHLLLGAMVLFGVYLLAPSFSFESDSFVGICFGVLSAVFFAVRNILVKSNAKNYDQAALMFNQLSITAILLAPLFLFLDGSNAITFLPETILLAVVTTAIGHTLFVFSLKNFSASSASLMSSLQPLYGIVFAIFLLGEFPSLNTVLGGLVIIATVVVESLRIKKSS